ncbi:UNVERIFIED_CONTAM: hypothetical protein FKN15_055946 [Acipenser sinensis]
MNVEGASTTERQSTEHRVPKCRASRCVHRVSRRRRAERRAPKSRGACTEHQSVERRGACTERRDVDAPSVEVRAPSAERRAPNPKCRSTKHQVQKRCTKRRSAAPSAEALTPKAPERERRSAGTERGMLAQTPTHQLTRRAEMLSGGTVSDAVQYLPDGAGDFSR